MVQGFFRALYDTVTNKYYKNRIDSATEILIGHETLVDPVDSISLDTGANLAGVAGDLTDVGSNYVTFDEVTGVPGFDFRINFASIVMFDFFSLVWKYNGSLTHVCLIQLYNHSTAAWDTFDSTWATPDFVNHTFAVPNYADYINSGAVNARIYHVTSGNASHDAEVDFCCLLTQSVEFTQ
jgi:hypothetical protein